MSDVQALDSSGNPQPETPSEEGQVVEQAAPVESAPFHTYKGDDGKETVFKTPDELNDFVRQGTLRHADYTRKTQTVAEARKLLDQRSKDYETKERNFNESYSGIMRYDKFLKENPQIAERIAAEMKGSVGNTDVERLIKAAVEPLNEKLSGYEQEKARIAEDADRSKAYDLVAQKHSDFDRAGVDAAIQRLNEMPEEMRLEAMVELVHLSEKGRLTPGAIERKQAMVAAKPKAKTPTSSVGIPDSATPMTRKEEEAAAIAALEAVQSG